MQESDKDVSLLHWVEKLRTRNLTPPGPRPRNSGSYEIFLKIENL